MTVQFDEIARWLIREGRLSGDSIAIIEGFAQRLTDAGVPLWRLRVNQRMSNPLLAAWGMIWRRDEKDSQEYLVPREMLETSAWFGSPFEYVKENRRPFRRRLVSLETGKDHVVLHELAAEGATDFLALPIEYGDGSIQGMSLVTDHPNGFDDAQVALLERLRDPLAAALEPSAMRRSTSSLLRTYIGQGPSQAVAAGAIRRGDISRIDAVILISDLRGFTDKSNRWSEEALLLALGSYFDLFVESVTKRHGDVLKFLGDGILAVFPIDEVHRAAERCEQALQAVVDAKQALVAVNDARINLGDETLDFGTALHLGPVTYGNVGSPDRLDFTVIGDAVNLTSRVEGLCKPLAEPILLTSEVARHLKVPLRSLGHQTVKGLREPIEVLAP